LPEPVLQRAQRELLEHETTGVSILEISHRAKEFTALMNRAEKDLRQILDIPDNYKVLFLQGGGTGQFAAVPLNLRWLSKAEKPSANYIVTGGWSSKAAKEAAKYVEVRKCIEPPLKEYTRIPDQSHWKIDPDAAYMYYCDNETIHGVEFNFIPDCKGMPLVCDFSSNALSRSFPVEKFGVLFCGTQKNLGTAGCTTVIVRDDLMNHACKLCPSVFEYKSQADMNSVYNTPPVYSIYMMSLVLEWIRDEGGLPEMERRANIKSKLIYDVVDDSKGFYHCPIELGYRSRMNIPFHIGTAQGVEKLEKLFLAEAENRSMISLKGHRSVGGIRASLYNAVTVEETQMLADFMKEFYEKHGETEP